MAAIDTILIIISLLFIAEGLFVFLFPKKTISMTKKFFKKANLRALGIIELLVGVALLVFVLMRIY